jgi:hypothetical protein
MDRDLPSKKDIHHTINTPNFNTKRNKTHTLANSPTNTHTLNSPTKLNPSLPHHAIQSTQETSQKVST